MKGLESERDKAGLDAFGRQCLADKTEILQTLMRRLEPSLLGSPDFQVLLADYFELRKDPAQVRSSLQKALDLRTTHAEANYRLSKIAAAEGEQDTRLKHLRRVLLELPKTEREREYFRLAFFELVEIETPAETIRLAEAMLKIQPGDADALLVRARAALELRDLAKLSDSLERLRKNAKTPQHNLALPYLKGELSRIRREWPAAIEAYASLLRQRGVPESWQLAAYKGITEAHLETKSPSKARVTALEGLKIAPKDSRLRGYLERALQERAPGETSGPTDAQFRAAMELFPSSRELHKAWVADLVARGQGPAADIELAKLLGDGSAPEPELWYWKSVLAARQAVFSQGLVFAQKALDTLRAGKKPGGGVKPKHIYLQAARMQKTRGYFDEARKILEEGLKASQDREDRLEFERELRASGKR